MEGLTVNVNVNINSEGDARSMEQAIFQYAMPALKDLRQKEKNLSIILLRSFYAMILIHSSNIKREGISPLHKYIFTSQQL